jgi:uncharacterized membrane protein HdeD (DUF308 family)
MLAVSSILAQEADISFRPDLEGIIALAAGILIFVVPKLLNYIVAGWLIIFGLIRVFNVNI